MQTGCMNAIRRRMWEANHLFRIMLFKGFVPDVVTYNCLIDGCCKTNRIERALELFDDMNKRGCLPNHVTYNSFIRYYSAVNEIDNAIETFWRMQKMGHVIPTSSSYTPIIHALCEAGRGLEARDFVVEGVNVENLCLPQIRKVENLGLLVCSGICVESVCSAHKLARYESRKSADLYESVGCLVGSMCFASGQAGCKFWLHPGLLVDLFGQLVGSGLLSLGLLVCYG
ncbi:Pentatricopeptide repeat-containing protein [Camellia lanceoleosa]|uniref:Pentatricopeptide repeat-containing protein n=1 Tax=Camellia lanceoleosa TaxID=1840588 RepID=A0ACC0GM78_9ERIC|nr:Pentatricopeptide repeat-containing protein [Camellia lanceoleosa]